MAMLNNQRVNPYLHRWSLILKHYRRITLMMFSATPDGWIPNCSQWVGPFAHTQANVVQCSMHIKLYTIRTSEIYTIYVSLCEILQKTFTQVTSLCWKTSFLILQVELHLLFSGENKVLWWISWVAISRAASKPRCRRKTWLESWSHTGFHQEPLGSD